MVPERNRHGWLLLCPEVKANGCVLCERKGVLKKQRGRVCPFCAKASRKLGNRRWREILQDPDLLKQVQEDSAHELQVYIDSIA